MLGTFIPALYAFLLSQYLSIFAYFIGESGILLY